MSTRNKHCPGIYGKCAKIMPYWDDHRVCRACRGYSCSPTSTCEVCGSWSEDTWKKFSKCLQRASKSKVATIAQAPEKGPGQPSATLGSLSGSSVQVTDASTRISRANREPESESLPQTPGIIAAEIDREPEQDSSHQAPGAVLYGRELVQDSLPQAPDHNISPSRRSLSSAGHERTRSVTPSSNRPLPRQYTSRPGRPRSKRIRVSSSSSSSSRASSSSRERSRRVKRKHRRSRHRSRSPLPRPISYGHARRDRHPRSRSPRCRPRSSRTRHQSRSRSRHHSRSRSRHQSRSRQLSRSRARQLSGSRSPSPVKQDNSVSVLTQLVQQQGQMLKELSSRLDNLNPKSTPVPVESHDSHESTDQVELHVGSEERIGNSDLDEPNEEREEDCPKESLSYREAIGKLRFRLGQSLCPVPEVKHKSVGASALDFFKESEQSDELSLALPQSNSVVVALDRMDKRLKGEEEIPMTPLPSYPKCFKGGSFVALNSKPRICLPSSYEALNPRITMDPPPVNPGIRDVLRQGVTVPSSQAVQFSTLENWEKLARTGMQVASHSEMFLCGTLKTIQQDSLSREDMMEVSRYLQAVAASQSHLVEILARLASGPLLARRDACLDASDLDPEVKRSLRVQPIESGTVFGSKFPEVVRQYKEGLAHKSLQMAVVGANKRQPSFKKRTPKTPDTPAKPAFSEPNVSVGSNLPRTSTFSQGKNFNKFQKKKTVKAPYFNRLPKKGSGPKSSAP